MVSSTRILAFVAFALPTLACNFATDLANEVIDHLPQQVPPKESSPGESIPPPVEPRLLPTEIDPAATFGPDPGATIPLEIRAQMDGIQAEVVPLRGLHSP